MEQTDTLYHFIQLNDGEMYFVYKVIKIHRGEMTSFIDLLNLDTGTKDRVFDDSSMVDIGYDDFEFMREGGVYDCKIELFGDFDRTKTEHSIEIIIFDTSIIIGKTEYFKVLIGSDVYYILKADAKGFEIERRMYYHFSRKDLIQVDNVIHADCLQ